ncbi:MAG: peptidylprolyl isomerase [Pirellulales bacterium]|nr:peptidylprolyl isomerase [Pirellulales bacterium]
MQSSSFPQIHRAAGYFGKLVAGIQSGLLLLTLAACNSAESSAPTLALTTPQADNRSSNSQSEKPKYNPFPEVAVKTSAGAFTLKLDAQTAPVTVSNFLFYVNRGKYDGTLLHEVYRGFIVLGGGFDEKSSSPRPGDAPIRNEAHRGRKNKRGTIAMARPPDNIDGATNQFFINLADNASLDYEGSEPSQYGYCVFGEVVSGMDVIDHIGEVQVHSTSQFENSPVEPIVIRSMRQLK